MASQRPVGIPVPSEEARVPGKLEKRPAPAQSRRQRPGDPGVALSHVPPAPFSGGGAPLTPVPGEGPHLPPLADAWVSPACRCGFFPPLIINDPVEDFTASQNPGPSWRDFCRQASISGGLTLAGGHFTATWYKTDEHIDVESSLQARPARLPGRGRGSEKRRVQRGLSPGAAASPAGVPLRLSHRAGSGVSPG